MRFDSLSFRPFDDQAEWDSVVIEGTIRLTWLEACELCNAGLWERIESAALEQAREDYMAKFETELAACRNFKRA